MDQFKCAVIIAWSNLCRWKKDLRITLIFLFTALIIIEDLQGFTQYGLDMGKQCTVCMLPVIFMSSTISVGAMKMVIFVGMLLLLCDAPFLSQVSPYVIYRSGRKVWWQSGCVYIVIVTFLYTVFITLVSSLAVFPVASFSSGSWGGVLEDMAFGSDTMTPMEIIRRYWHGTLPELCIKYMRPYMAQTYTFLSVWACFIFLGFMMYMVSQFTQNVLWILSFPGVFVFLDPILDYFALGGNAWMRIFSPVTLVSPEVLNLVDENRFFSVPFVIFTFLVLNIMLLISSWMACLKRKELL